MSTNDTDRAKLTAARAFIKDDERELARSILVTMPENKKAQEWLAKLGNEAKYQSAAAKKETSGKYRWPLVLLGLLVGLVIGVGGGLLLGSDDDKAVTPTVAAVVETEATETVAAPVEETPETELTQAAMPEDTPQPEETAAMNPTEVITPESLVAEQTPEGELTPPVGPAFDPDTEAIVLDSEADGLMVAYAEYAFPDGFYTVTVTTAGAFRLDIDATNGTCTNGILGVIEVAAGEAEAGVAVPFGSTGCVADIIIDEADAPWTLIFQRMELVTEMQADTFTYTSEDVGMDASIGPVTLPSGYYDVMVTTTGLITVNFQEMDGLCNVNIFGLFNLSEAGEAAGGKMTDMVSLDCTGMILVNNATAPWTLAFEKTDDIETDE